MGKQGRAALEELAAVQKLVVAGALLPAVKENSNPLECQGANRRMVFLSSLTLQLVIGFGPGGARERMVGELVERLPEELYSRVVATTSSEHSLQPKRVAWLESLR